MKTQIFETMFQRAKSSDRRGAKILGTSHVEISLDDSKHLSDLAFALQANENTRFLAIA